MKIANRIFLCLIYMSFIHLIYCSEDNSEYMIELVENEPEEIEEWDGYLTAHYVKTQEENANYQVIDPINYIDNDELYEELDEKLKLIYDEYNFNTFTIIVNSLDPDFNYLRVGLEQYIKEFKYYLLKNNPNLSEENLIVILFSLDDEYDIIRSGDEVKKKLSESEQNLIVTSVRSKIRNLQFEYLNNLFDDLYYYMDHCDDCVSFWVGIGFFIFFGIGFIILMIIFIYDLIRGKRVNENEEKKIKRMGKFLNEFNSENVENNKINLINNTCFICMYKLNENNTDEEKQINDAIKEIICKHKFHSNCWEDWVIKNEEICPICSESLKYDDSFEDVQKKIISIQRNIHKDFNQIKFRYKRNKLKYKFIDFGNKDTVANLY